MTPEILIPQRRRGMQDVEPREIDRSHEERPVFRERALFPRRGEDFADLREIDVVVHERFAIEPVLGIEHLGVRGPQLAEGHTSSHRSAWPLACAAASLAASDWACAFVTVPVPPTWRTGVPNPRRRRDARM